MIKYNLQTLALAIAEEPSWLVFSASSSALFSSDLIRADATSLRLAMFKSSHASSCALPSKLLIVSTMYTNNSFSIWCLCHTSTDCQLRTLPAACSSDILIMCDIRCRSSEYSAFVSVINASSWEIRITDSSLLRRSSRLSSHSDRHSLKSGRIGNHSANPRSGLKLHCQLTMPVAPPGHFCVETWPFLVQFQKRLRMKTLGQ